MTTDPNRDPGDRAASPFSCFDRRYLLELAPGLGGIVVAAALIFLLPRTPVLVLWVRGLVAVAAGYTIVVSIAAIRRLDELQQRIQLIAIAISFAGTGVLVIAMDFLEELGAPRLDGYSVWMVMAGLWFGGILLLRRRYR